LPKDTYFFGQCLYPEPGVKRIFRALKLEPLNYFIYDIEATCWRHAAKKTPETIEIGGVLLDDLGREKSRFHRFVSPKEFPQLSPFCMEMTGIDQEDIDRAQSFKEVLIDLQAWLNLYGFVSNWMSWGTFDLTQLKNEALKENLDTGWFPEHIDLKSQFGKIHGLADPPSVKTALGMLNLKWIGDEHRALSDAENTARIFQMLMHKWTFIS
jgi:3'-5' exoribonuclease 1